MPEYKNSKIYAIKSEQAQKYYIGATTKRLCQRMAQHRQNYNKYVDKKVDHDCSFDILQFSDAQIQLLESYECNTKDELNNKLQSYLTSYKDKIVNKPKEKKPKEPKPKESKPREKKIKVSKKKVLKEIEETIKEIPQPPPTPIIESDSEYKSSEEELKEEPKEEPKGEPKEEPKGEPKKEIQLMNYLQAKRAGLI